MRIIFFLFSLIVLSSCSKLPNFSKKGDKLDNAVVKVGRTSLMESEVSNNISEALNRDGKFQYVTEWTNRTLYAEAAKRQGYHKSKEFKQKIENIKRDLLAARFLDSVVSEIKSQEITNIQIKNYFEANRDSFTLREDQILFDKIVVETGKFAWEIRSFLKSSNFHKNANKYSRDRVIPKAELTFVNRSDLHPNLKEYLFTIKEDGVALPRKVDSNFYLCHVIEKRKAGDRATFEYVKNEVYQDLLRANVSKEVDKINSSLRERDDYYFNTQYFSETKKSKNETSGDTLNATY
jgi:hypothetical protein